MTTATGQLTERGRCLRGHDLQALGAIAKRLVGLLLKRAKSALHEFGIGLESGSQGRIGLAGIEAVRNLLAITKSTLSTGKYLSRLITHSLSRRVVGAKRRGTSRIAVGRREVGRLIHEAVIAVVELVQRIVERRKVAGKRVKCLHLFADLSRGEILASCGTGLVRSGVKGRVNLLSDRNKTLPIRVHGLLASRNRVSTIHDGLYRGPVGRRQ